MNCQLVSDLRLVSDVFVFYVPGSHVVDGCRTCKVYFVVRIAW